MSKKIKICEICDDEFETDYLQERYCTKCGKDPDRKRKEYEWASERVSRHAGLNDIPKKQICENCGKEFLSAYTRKTCSNACGNEYEIKTAKCPICRALLIEHGNNTGSGVCSEECRQKLILQKEEARIKQAKEDGDYIECRWCKKLYVRRNYSNEFCSRDCFSKYNEEKRKRLAADRSELMSSHEYLARHADENRNCIFCGKEFTCKRYQNNIYCSKECRDERTKQKITTKRRKN